MELSSSQKETIQHQFESFCKSVLRNWLRNYIRDMQQLTEHELPLYNALMRLPTQKRDIVLLAHCLGKTDVEIGAMLNMVSRTVQYQRTSSLAKLKQYMEERDDEQTQA